MTSIELPAIAARKSKTISFKIDPQVTILPNKDGMVELLLGFKRFSTDLVPVNVKVNFKLKDNYLVNLSWVT